MLISCIISYFENCFLVFWLSFNFILAIGASARNQIRTEGPGRHTGTGCHSSGRTLLTRSREVPVHTARCGRHASKRAGKPLRSQGNLHRTKRSRLLATLRQIKSMYTNTSGYVHRWGTPWTGVTAPRHNRDSVQNHFPTLGPTPQWHAGTGVQTEPMELPKIHRRLLPREGRPDQPHASSRKTKGYEASQHWLSIDMAPPISPRSWGLKMGCFSPSCLWLKKSKIDPSAGPH